MDELGLVEGKDYVDDLGPFSDAKGLSRTVAKSEGAGGKLQATEDMSESVAEQSGAELQRQVEQLSVDLYSVQLDLLEASDCIRTLESFYDQIKRSAEAAMDDLDRQCLELIE